MARVKGAVTTRQRHKKILKLAKQIEDTADALLVVGIGGSYLGAKAGIEMLGNKKSKVESTLLFYFSFTLKKSFQIGIIILSEIITDGEI